MIAVKQTITPATQARIDALKVKLAARTDSTGAALPGFTINVDAIRAEIARLEAGGDL